VRALLLRAAFQRRAAARSGADFELRARPLTRTHATGEDFLAELARLEAEAQRPRAAPPLPPPVVFSAPPLPNAPPPGGSRGVGAHAAARAPPGGWTCVVCTRDNAPHAPSCLTCGGLRPAGAPPPPVAPPPPRPLPPAARPPAAKPAAAKPSAHVAAPQAQPQAEQRALVSFFAPAAAPRVEAAELPPVDRDGLADCPTATPGMRIDPRAAATFVYPAQREQRTYQLSITRKALFTNTLVCLPTGMVRAVAPHLRMPFALGPLHPFACAPHRARRSSPLC
jgi:hypothetical protein